MTEATLTEEERQAAAIKVAEAHRAGSSEEGRPTDTEITATPTPDAPVRPEHVPEKFWDAETGDVNFEAWNKAHNELETKFHQGDKSETDETAGDKSATDVTDETPAEAPTHITDAQSEYMEKGELTDKTYETLAANGLDRGTVDAYIAGQKVAADAQTNIAHDATEGEENYTAMVEWASETLSETELKAYNAQVSTGDDGVIKSAVAGLYTKFREGGTYEGERLGGNASSTDAGKFADKADYTAAMRKSNPDMPGKSLYESDAGYRNEVIKKVNASRKAGINIFV